MGAQGRLKRIVPNALSGARRPLEAKNQHRLRGNIPSCVGVFGLGKGLKRRRHPCVVLELIPPLGFCHDLFHDALLAPAAFKRFVIRGVAEGDLRVQRKPLVRMLALKASLELFLFQKLGIPSQVAHFDVVLEREFHDCVASGLSQCGVGRHDALPVVVLVEQFVQHRAVFHAAVHTLSVKGDNGVGRISHQGNTRPVIPWKQRVMTRLEMGCVFQSSASWAKGKDVRKVPFEKRLDGFVCGQCSVHLLLHKAKQRAGESLVGKGNAISMKVPEANVQSVSSIWNSPSAPGSRHLPYPCGK